MAETQSTRNRFNPFATKEKRDTVVDTALDAVDTSLKLLDVAADFLPVAGVSTVVLVLRSMMEQIRNTRTNSKVAVELKNDIIALAELINGIVQQLRDRVSPVARSLSDEERTRINSMQANKSGKFKTTIDKLHEDIKPLPEAIQKSQRGNAFSRMIRNSDIKEQLEDVRNKFVKAKENFQLTQLTIVTSTVEELEADIATVIASLGTIAPAVDRIQAMGVETALRIDDNKYDDDLRALPFVNASYNAVGEAGLLEGTRVELIDEVQGWASGSESSGFFIITGAAGMGKSTIMREVAYRLEKEGRLGASYFFVRSDAGAIGSMHSVFPTIAFQLASLQPVLRPFIANAARKFMKFQSRSLKEQLETLLLSPLADAQTGVAYPLEDPIVVVVDALDEASGDLITFLKALKGLVDKQHRFLILITTRPEAPILDALGKADIAPSARRVDLEHIAQDVIDGDIQRFFEAGFDNLRWREELCSVHPNAIELLTKRAEGVFVYARTVINHLSVHKPETAVHRLSTILNDAHGPAGLSALDKLYTFVLENANSEEDMKIPNVRRRVTAVLAGLVILQGQVTIKILAPLMGVTEDDAVRTVEELRSIVTCSGPDLRKDIIRPLHLTLREFLVDKKRCKNRDILIDRQLHHRNVAESCLRIMNKALHRDMCQLGNAFKDEVEELDRTVNEHVPPHVQYACTFWSAHAVENEPGAAVQQPLGTFCNENLLAWAEAMSLMSCLGLAIRILLEMHSWAKDLAEFGDITTLLYDGYRLVATFFEAINRSPSLLYSSVLSFAPNCRLVEVYAKARESNCLISPRDTVWGSCLHILSGRYFYKPAFSGDRKFLALPLDSTVEVRDATTLDLQKTLECATDVVSVDFHPRDCSLVSALCRDGTVEEWNLSADTHSRYEVCEVDREYDLYDDKAAYKVAYNADGTSLICSWIGVDGIFVHSTEDRSQILMGTTAPSMEFKTFSFDSDGRHVDALLVPEDERAVVKRWNIETGDEVKSLQMATRWIGCAVFSKNNPVLITGHFEEICVWTLGSDSSTLSTTINGDWTVTAIDVTRSGDVIASSGSDNVIRLFDASSGVPLAVYEGHTRPIKSVVFSPQEDRLVSTSYDNTVRVWDTKEEAWSLDSASNSRYFDNVVFSPSGKFIAARSWKDILVWDGTNGSILSTLTGHTDNVHSLAFSPNSALLASFSPSDGVFLWSDGTKESIPGSSSIFNTVNSLDFFWIVFSTTGSQLAVVNETFTDESGTHSFQVRIWNVSNSNGDDSAKPRNELFQSKRNYGRCPHFLRFSSKESLMLVRHLDPDDGHKVIIWDRMADAVEEHDYDEDSHSSLKPAFVDDQGWTVSIRTGRLLFWLPESRRPRFYSSFATYESLIATGSEAGVLSLVDMSPFEGL